MRLLKFSGREAAIVRAIDFATGTLGAELLVRTRIGAEEVVEIINGLMDAGYVETNPPRHGHVERGEFYWTMFEANPAFVHQLREATARR
jgi:hypothetical protein